MNVAPRYLGRGSWLARRDPRVLILAIALFVFAVVQVWDGRLMVVLAVVAFLYYRTAGIPFRAVRYQCAYVLIFVGFIVTTNTIITGGELRGIDPRSVHTYFYLPLFGTPVSAESTSYAITQLLRFLSMAALGFPIAFAIGPSDIGPAFARLHVPDRFAYAIDLTFRFIPSLAGGMQTTIDAMDLRCFGTGRRTWLRELVMDRTDRALLVGFALLFLLVTVLAFNGASNLWVFPFLIPR